MRRPGFLGNIKTIKARLGNFGQGPQTAHAQANAHGKTVSLQCPAGTIEVTNALYGENCKSQACYNAGKQSAVKSHIAAACNGLFNCDYKVDEYTIGDPCPHCFKDYKVTYGCIGIPASVPPGIPPGVPPFIPPSAPSSGLPSSFPDYPPEEVFAPTPQRRSKAPLVLGLLLLGGVGIFMFLRR